MRILLDTNIFIHREDDHVLPEDFQRLLKILNQIKVDLLLHPLSIEEISKDKNKERKEILLSKIKSYRTLEAPPDPEGDYNYLKIVGYSDKINDQIDNAILYAIHRNAVDFLITEDRGIHKKASRLEVDNRVLLIDDALQLFEGYIYKERIISPPALKDEFVYNLDIEDTIFDSVKKDYEEFEDWFEKISKDGRKCWVYYRNGGSIGAILIYKFEEEPIDAKPSLPKKRRLKLSTFKVTYVGNKIGELYIKSAIDISIRNDISEIYLTQFTKPEDRLVGLISEYGFYKAAVNRRGGRYLRKKINCRGRGG